MRFSVPFSYTVTYLTRRGGSTKYATLFDKIDVDIESIATKETTLAFSIPRARRKNVPFIDILAHDDALYHPVGSDNDRYDEHIDLNTGQFEAFTDAYHYLNPFRGIIPSETTARRTYEELSQSEPRLLILENQRDEKISQIFEVASGLKFIDNILYEKTVEPIYVVTPDHYAPFKVDRIDKANSHQPACVYSADEYDLMMKHVGYQDLDDRAKQFSLSNRIDVCAPQFISNKAQHICLFGAAQLVYERMREDLAKNDHAFFGAYASIRAIMSKYSAISNSVDALNSPSEGDFEDLLEALERSVDVLRANYDPNSYVLTTLECAIERYQALSDNFATALIA